jgi:hypothetical protein
LCFCVDCGKAIGTDDFYDQVNCYLFDLSLCANDRSFALTGRSATLCAVLQAVVLPSLRSLVTVARFVCAALYRVLTHRVDLAGAATKLFWIDASLRSARNGIQNISFGSFIVRVKLLYAYRSIARFFLANNA